MRILTLRDEALFHLIRFLCRNRRRTLLENLVAALRLRYLTPEIRRILRYAQDRRVIKIRGKRVYMYHDIEPIFTYFEPSLFIRSTNRSEIARACEGTVGANESETDYMR